MLTKKQKHAYLDLSESKESPEVDFAERRVSDELNRIEDAELRLHLDELIGELVLAHEFKGYEIGAAENHFRGVTKLMRGRRRRT